MNNCVWSSGEFPFLDYLLLNFAIVFHWLSCFEWLEMVNNWKNSQNSYNKQLKSLLKQINNRWKVTRIWVNYLCHSFTDSDLWLSTPFVASSHSENMWNFHEFDISFPRCVCWNLKNLKHLNGQSNIDTLISIDLSCLWTYEFNFYSCAAIVLSNLEVC